MRQLRLEEVAFCQPGGEGTRAAASQPVDLAHLGAQTMDDRDLQSEVLKLFIHSAEMFVVQLDSADGKRLRSLAHKLKGSARAIGAFALADKAAELEERSDDAAVLKAVRDEIVRVEDFIASILR
ncbi:MAG: Hpt domain-containing protein [Brucellaceae bacterium]|nr:Hpt domain-containing protein [Brucellaceae bacterium]